MEKILFDTSFVLPLFGIQLNISEHFHQELKSVWKNGLHNTNLWLSNISLLESLYLLNREYRVHEDISGLKRYKMVIPTIMNSENISIADSLTQPSIIAYANKIRSAGHHDYLDCLIFGTAAFDFDIIVTRESEIINLITQNKLMNETEILNWFAFVDRFNVSG